MLTRRALLGGVGFAALAGCGVLPDDSGTSPVPSPTGVLPGQTALLDLRTALAEAAAQGLTGDQAWPAWLLDVNDEQFRAVSLAAPATPTPASTPAAGAGADTTAGDTLLARALTRAQASFTAQALDTVTARPLVWGSMAAWCAAAAAVIPGADASREPARGFLWPAPQTATEAAQAALDAASAARYGLQVAAGAPGLDATEVDALAARAQWWAGVRDDLAAAATGPTASPTPAPPWYDLTPPTDAVAARALAARLQASALPILGRSLTHADAALRPALVAGLVGAATDVPAWGGLLERWPGLPTT